MKTIVKDHNKVALAHKVFDMAWHDGWEPLSPITYEDSGFTYSTITYYCVMEKKGKRKQRKFNCPWGA
jgi:hypothetical protein